MSKRRLRLVFAVVMLVISLAVLTWGFLPGARIVRRQKIAPTEMQLPTPESFIPERLVHSLTCEPLQVLDGTVLVQLPLVKWMSA